MKAPSTAQDTRDPMFAEGTLGAFLVAGQSGWPTTFQAKLDDAIIGVASSRIRLECQRCSCRNPNASNRDIDKVRIALDMRVERDNEEHLLHVEELFPAHILQVLHAPMDEHAGARVRRIITDTLLELDEESPVENLITNFIAPMRLYEPLLNALVPPPERDSLAFWLDEELPMLLFEDKEELHLEVGSQHVCIQISELLFKTGLRAQGEVKLIAKIDLHCNETGEQRGQWKSRATLMKPTQTWHSLPAPSATSKKRIEDLAAEWRDLLRANITRRVEAGQTPIMLSDVAPELPLLHKLQKILDNEAA